MIIFVLSKDLEKLGRYRKISLSWIGVDKIQLLSQKDLIAMKTAAIIQRGTIKFS